MPVYSIEGVDVSFPYEAYPCQIEYMRKVILALEQEENALLESPTGTGKTLCLLCATLGWRESWAKRAASRPVAFGAPPPEPPLVVYASRTHSQLAQVIKELRATNYRVRTTVLGSRQQMCLHPKVSKMSGGNANFACRSLVHHRQCQWHNKQRLERTVTDIVTPVGASGGGGGGSQASGAAFGLGGGGSRDSAPGGNGGGGGVSEASAGGGRGASAFEPPDIEDLLKVGRTANVCPYFLSRDLVPHADVVFMPYNYLLDASAGRQLDTLRWENAIIILDEAHNVQDVCKGAASFDLTAQQRAAALTDIERAMELCEQRAGQEAGGVGLGEGPGYADLRERLDMGRGVLLELERAISGLDVPEAGLAKPGEALLELLAGVNLNPSTVALFGDMLKQASQVLSDEELASGRATAAKMASAGLDALVAALNVVFASREPLWRDGPPASRGYRMFVHKERVQSFNGLVEAPTLSYWCFVPGVSMHRLLGRRVRSILLTSGTLSPLESFAAELQLGFRHTLENPHIIEPHQVWVGLVPSGPTGTALNSSYSSRGSAKYKDDLGNALVNFARVVPDGLLVFFPAYSVMTACLEHWRAPAPLGGSSIWERLCRFKAPVIEPRDAASFPATIADYRAKLDDPGGTGAALFAVCRGKVSEGLDFSDRAGRGVVITGIPFGATHDPAVRLQRQVLDDELRSGPSGLTRGRGVSGEQWYVQQAARAVNQAMGRVIRHRWDYGAILLADERFGSQQNQRQLSKWLRQHLVAHQNFGSAIGSLTKFFKEKASFAPPPEVLRMQQQRDAARERAAAQRASAFEMLNTGRGAGARGRSGRGPMGPGPLMAPRAIDVSGFASIADATSAAAKAAAAAAAAASGSGGSGRGKGATAGGGAGGASSGGSGGGSLLLSDNGRPAGGSKGAAKPSTAAGGGPAPSIFGATTKAPRPAGGGILSGGVPPPAAAPRRPQITIEYQGSRGSGEALPSVVGPAHLVRCHGQPGSSQGAGDGEQRRMFERGSGSAGGLALLRASQQGEEQQQQQGSQQQGVQQQGVSRPEAPPPDEQPQQQPPPPPPPPQQQQQQQQQEPAGGHEGGGAGEGSAPAPAADPRAFMARLQRELRDDDYGAVKELLVAYRASRDVSALIEGVIEALRGPATCHLLAGFAAFLPAKDRSWYCATVAEHFKAATAAGGAAGKPPSQQRQSQQQPAAARPGSQQSGGAGGGRDQGPAGRAGGGGAGGGPQLPGAAAKRPVDASGAGAAVSGLAGAAGAAKRPRPAGTATAAAAAAGGSGGAGPRPLGAAQAAGSGPKPPEPMAAFLAKLRDPPKGHPPGAQDRQLPRDRAAGGPPAAPAGQQRIAGGAFAGGSAAAAGAGAMARAGAGAGAAGSRGIPPPGAAAGRGPPAAPGRPGNPKPCSACGAAPMEAAHRAPCGHLACYGCWLKLLSASMRGAKCPTCGKELRRAQLKAQPFA